MTALLPGEQKINVGCHKSSSPTITVVVLNLTSSGINSGMNLTWTTSTYHNLTANLQKDQLVAK
jgi:hypothetical protein